MANPVYVSDIAERWRPLSDGEVIVTQSLLADAWAIVVSAVPDIETRLAGNPPALNEALVKVVVSAMVLRVLRNPEGKLSEAIDDYKFTRDSARSAGTLYIDPSELALLAPSVSTGAFSIRPSYVPDDLASMHAWRAGLQ